MGTWKLLFLISGLSHLKIVLCALDFHCLKCLCETATECVSHPCDPETCDKIEISNYDCACGPFGITPPFWIAANKPLLDGKIEGDAEKFKKCVETFPCSIWAIQYYMEKYARDCDLNKLINCNDYVLIHTYGPNKCRNATLKGERLDRYTACMARISEIPTHPGTTEATETTESFQETEGTSKAEDYTTEDSTIKPMEELESQIYEYQFNEE